MIFRLYGLDGAKIECSSGQIGGTMAPTSLQGSDSGRFARRRGFPAVRAVAPSSLPLLCVFVLDRPQAPIYDRATFHSTSCGGNHCV